MGQLYQEHHEEDFFLYIAYSDESVYGHWGPAATICRYQGHSNLGQAVNKIILFLY